MEQEKAHGTSGAHKYERCSNQYERARKFAQFRVPYDGYGMKSAHKITASAQFAESSFQNADPAKKRRIA